MDAIRLVVIGANATLFGALGIHAARVAHRNPSTRLRALSWVVSATCGAFFLGALQRMALQGVRAGWLGDRGVDFLLTDWQLVQSLTALTLGLVSWGVIRRAEPGLWVAERAERMVRVLTERIPVDVSVSELGLTPRELEVLELICKGVLSDRELAEALYVSPGTVRTHVKNLLRKAGLSSRRDLMLLGESAAEERPS